MARGALARFFEAPISPKPLGVFRVLTAGFALLQAALLYHDWSAFFGPDAWIQWEISRAIGQQWQLHMIHVAALLQHFGCSAEQSVFIFYWCYVAALAITLIGWHTRVSTFVVWLCHFIMMNTIPTFCYGVDIFLHISLFYLLVMPVAKAYSLDAWLGRVSVAPSWGATLSRRVLQLHMCFVYISSGFEKVFAPEWWCGNVLWRSLVQPDFRQYDFTWLAHWPWIVILGSWFTIVIESGYTFAMWVPRLRVVWLIAIIVLHVSIAVCLGLWLFGLMMIILSISAFGAEALSDLRNLWNVGGAR